MPNVKYDCGHVRLEYQGLSDIDSEGNIIPGIMISEPSLEGDFFGKYDIEKKGMCSSCAKVQKKHDDELLLKIVRKDIELGISHLKGILENVEYLIEAKENE